MDDVKEYGGTFEIIDPESLEEQAHRRKSVMARVNRRAPFVQESDVTFTGPKYDAANKFWYYSGSVKVKDGKVVG